MLEGLASAHAWGTPVGLGFLLACLGVFFWGLSKIAKLQ